MHIFSWICSRGTRLIEGAPWAIVEGSKSSVFFPLIWRWVLGQQQKKKEKKITGLSFKPVLLFGFFFSFVRKKILKWMEGRADRCDGGEEVWALGQVVVRGWGGGLVGVVNRVPPLFTRCCCCCSPGLYTECPRHCSLCQGAGRRTCPHTNRCLVCDREKVCTAGQQTGSQSLTESRRAEGMEKVEMWKGLFERVSGSRE